MGQKACDVTVFDRWTEPTAWLMGLLFSDGALNEAHHGIALSSIDKDLVLKMKAILRSGHAIYVMAPRSDAWATKVQYRISIRNAALFYRLVELGLAPLKADRTQFPKMPDELLPHFIRGVFDGDGGISIKASPQAYFAGRAQFAAALRDHLNHVGIRTSRLYLPTQTTGIGTFHIWHQDDLLRLYRYMYQGATVWGDRKFAKWQQWLQSIGEAA